MAEPSAALLALGAVVRRLRQERDMSQWELSERAGIHKNTPGLIERAERSPALETINASPALWIYAAPSSFGSQRITHNPI